MFEMKNNHDDVIIIYQKADLTNYKFELEKGRGVRRGEKQNLNNHMATFFSPVK